ncbi:MAG: sigma-70 family RNA polymerase sigma factor [Synechococcaceae cyanobacterium]|jgi:RNA polymerase sigma-B factor
MKKRTPSAAALAARDRLARRHLTVADAVADAFARRLRGLADRDDLRQEARLALLQAAARVAPGADPLPYLRRSVAGAMHRYVRDQIRMVRVPRRVHEAWEIPLGHISLDVPIGTNGDRLLDRLAAPQPQPETAAPGHALARQVLDMVERLPAKEAAAVRLTVLEGRSLRQASQALDVSAMTAGRYRTRGLDSLRLAVGA